MDCCCLRTNEGRNKPVRRFVWILAVFAFLLLSQKAAAALTVSAKSTTPEITRPGAVAVDVPARRKLLSQFDQVQLCPNSLPYGRGPLFDRIVAPPDYGLDERFNSVSAHFRSLGATCLGGTAGACKAIYDYALDWARNSKLKGPKIRNERSALFWNTTLTANMRLLSPMLAALGVADQVSPLPKSQREVLNKWIKSKVDAYEHGMRGAGRYEGGRDGTRARKAAHNHAVQSSIVAMSYGAWSNNKKYFRTGIQQWFITLKSMRKNGSLPIETRRGARALFYHGRTLSALVQLAERAAVQGIDLYNSAPKKNKTIHHAVAFFINAVENPNLVLKYAKTNKAPGPSKNYKVQDLGSSSTMGWIAPYISRFPDHPNSLRLRARKNVKHSEPRNYLTGRLDAAVRTNGYSAEWIGVDARCFYAAPLLP